jgi:hypothetical protein
MRSLILFIAVFCLSFALNAQNTPPTLKGQSVVALYGQLVCIDIETEDLDGDSVFIGSNAQIPQSTFTSTNSQKKQATGSFCVTIERGVHSYHLPYTMVFYATDKKDTVYRSFNLTIMNHPYKVRPIVKWLTNSSFEIDVKGDKNEPWESYSGLKFETKIFDTNKNLLLTDTNRVITFNASAYEKYILYVSYLTSYPALYVTRDTLYPNQYVSTHSLFSQNLKVYPNPTTDKVFIDNLPQDVKAIRLFDALGKEIKITMNQNSILLNHLPNGIYWVAIETSQGALSRQKIIKTTY